MHPHLDNVDNAGCAEVMAAFEECHAKGFIWKSMGMCNGAKTALNTCLKAERAKRVVANRSNAQDKNGKIRALWKEIDEQS
ncbi:cmc1-like, cytochrome c oxidase biogenesis protein [Grosmannia clavigera kw1407]|uniref:COX assembly mitochondrial protein n=1 Tax=Grosmannia clavigera (strain kw1407 / UAMH 11150) TaxID=655863 RepID=F0X9D9_GROCL|nr:cmc1-like, cytochrome c oxidase biogenesis protein [Grosmannia clavigera kw1407]EFX05350.1 cmc1-like, cytochrome c oxidase biogenesis protein [Grosmannia clavigera kw1407]